MRFFKEYKAVVAFLFKDGGKVSALELTKHPDHSGQNTFPNTCVDR